MSVLVDGLTYSSMGRLPSHAEKSIQYLLVRLLTGSLSVSNGGQTAKQRMDYSALPPALQTRGKSQVFSDFLVSYSVGGDTATFVKSTTADNRKFYQDLLSEFSNYFLQSGRGSHTAAFVFLYRILEKLSYTVPLLYCSTQHDYIGTFNELKALFDPSVKGELGLFKKFLNQGKFIDALKLDINYNITFSSGNGHQGDFFRLTGKHHTDLASRDATLNQIEISFRQVPELLKTLRNRFFHALTGDGKNNIRVEEILNPDEYFACVNPIFCSFLSIVALHTLAHKYQV